MVDALVEIHRVLAPDGILVDARPDSRVLAYAERRKRRGFRRFGVVKTNRLEIANDRASDNALASVVREGLFKRRRRGRFWHLVPFGSLADLRNYLREHLRFVHRAEWVVDGATRKRHANDQFVIRRAVRYELLEAVRSPRNHSPARPPRRPWRKRDSGDTVSPSQRSTGGVSEMGANINRRQLLVGAGAGALGTAAALSAAPLTALAAESEDGEGVEGSWYVKVTITSPPANVGSFDVLYAFAKGGVFTRVDGRNNGPGVGTWKRAAGGGIVFNAVTFNFNPGDPTPTTRNGGVLGDFSAHVDADGKLVGKFTAHGILGLANFQRAGTFTGTRIKASGTPDPT